MVKRRHMSRDTAESLAIEAIGFLASEPERLGRFLALTGLGPADIRASAHESRFLQGVLEYIAGNEAELLLFAEHAGIDPAALGLALTALGQTNWEREVP